MNGCVVCVGVVIDFFFFYVYPVRPQQQPSGQLTLPNIGQLVYGPTCGASGWGRLKRALNRAGSELAHMGAVQQHPGRSQTYGSIKKACAGQRRIPQGRRKWARGARQSGQRGLALACTAASQVQHKACGQGATHRPGGDLDNGSGSGSIEEKASQQTTHSSPFT